MKANRLDASFRDPAGFVFKNKTGNILRQVNKAGAIDFELLLSSGLYNDLAKQGIIVTHTPVSGQQAISTDAYKVIKPQQIPFITYPFEWSFSQLKDAALLTLAIQREALVHGMTLKDASAYNIQFLGSSPIFIDTLSFEKYVPGRPWQAYKQFCQHFLAPLALMAYTDTRTQQLLRANIDGIPLDLAKKLLPRRAKLTLGLVMHIVLHSKAQSAKEAKHERPTRHVSQASLEAILRNLEKNIQKLSSPISKTEWGDYYQKTNYSSSAADQKAKLIKDFIKPLKLQTVLDIGGNNGRYSRVLHELSIDTICTDIDPNAVEANYHYAKTHKEKHMLPMLVDVTNPGGALGWANQEREPIHTRLQTDAIMALAVIHHLAISNNVPLATIARYFSQFAPYLVIEFVPKEDSQVQKLLSTRADILPEYNEAGFQAALGQYFKLVKQDSIRGTKRSLYLFKRK